MLTQSKGLTGVRINLVQHNPDWSADNWDIANLQVSLFNPGSPQVCQLNLVGTSVLQDGSTGLVRLSKNAGSSGNGPSSPIFQPDQDQDARPRISRFELIAHSYVKREMPGSKNHALLPIEPEHVPFILAHPSIRVHTPSPDGDHHNPPYESTSPSEVVVRISDDMALSRKNAGACPLLPRSVAYESERAKSSCKPTVSPAISRIPRVQQHIE